MKRMAIIYALSMMFTYHVQVYGVDERRGFDTLFFGGIACLCCAVLYVFKHKSTIKRLRVEVTEKDQKIHVLEVRTREQKQDILDKTAAHFRLHQQLSDKEQKEKTFTLLLKSERRRFARLTQRCTRKSIKIKRMGYLCSLQHQRDMEKIKKLRLHLGEAKKQILELSERYYSLPSSSSSSSSEEFLPFFWNVDQAGK